MTYQLTASVRMEIKRRLETLPQRRLTATSERSAGVLVPLCQVNGEASILFTKRSDRVGTHKGQVSFPGGMKDPGDASFIDTALRETEEEIGYPREAVDILGTFHEAQAITGVRVVPVIGFLKDLKDLESLRLSQAEIDQAFTLSLAEILDPTKRKRQQLGPRQSTFVFEAGPFPVWGLTAYILEQVVREALHLPFPSSQTETS